MTDATTALRLLISGDSLGAQKAVRDVGVATKTLGDETTKTQAKYAAVGKSMTSVGSTMTKTITLPVVAMGAASVVMASKFEDSMKLIQTQAGGSSQDVKVLSNDILHMKDVQHSPQQLADAMYHLKSVGMDNKAAMDALTQSEHLASVGQSDLETTTNAVAGAYKSGVAGAQDFAQAAATINAIVGAGNMRMTDLVSAMGTGFLVSAKQAGVSLVDVGAALADMTARGIPAVRSATALKMMFAAMEAPTAKAAKVMAELGMKQDDLAKAMRSGGLPAAVNMLKDHLQGLSLVAQTADLTKMFGAKSAQAILTLIGDTKDYAKVQKQVEQNATTSKFAEAVKAQSETAGASWGRLKSDLGQLSVQFGTILLPILLKVTAAVAWIAKEFLALPGPLKTAIVVAALFAAALGPVLIITGKILSGWTSITGAISKFKAWRGGGASGAGTGGAGGSAATDANTAAERANTAEVNKNTFAEKEATGATKKNALATDASTTADKKNVLATDASTLSDKKQAVASDLSGVKIGKMGSKAEGAAANVMGLGGKAAKAEGTVASLGSKAASSGTLVAGMGGKAAKAESGILGMNAASIKTGATLAGLAIAIAFTMNQLQKLGNAIDQMNQAAAQAGQAKNQALANAKADLVLIEKKYGKGSKQYAEELAIYNAILKQIQADQYNKPWWASAASGVKSGVGKAWNWAFGGSQGSGGSYDVTKPTVFIAGESGPEHAIFIPHGKAGTLPRGGGGGRGGGGTMKLELHLHGGTFIGTTNAKVGEDLMRVLGPLLTKREARFVTQGAF